MGYNFKYLLIAFLLFSFISCENSENEYHKKFAVVSAKIEASKAGYEILGSLWIRSRGGQIISCPSCARQAFPVIETVKILESK